MNQYSRRKFLGNARCIASFSALAPFAGECLVKAEDNDCAVMDRHKAAMPPPISRDVSVSQTASKENLLDVQRDPRVVAVYRTLTTPPRDHLVVKEEESRGSDVRIDATWSIGMTDDLPEMVKAAAVDFRRFLRDELGVAFTDNASGRNKITMRIASDCRNGSIDANKANAGSNRTSKRAHAIIIGNTGVEIVGASEWGVACGFYHLQRLLRLGKSPRIKTGTIEAAPALEPSLTYLAFQRSGGRFLDYPIAFNDEYLCRIARAGYTGFHVDLEDAVFANSTVLPELNCAGGDGPIETLRQVAAKARHYGLEVYVTLYSAMRPKNHPIFLRHPDLRGSRIVNTDDYILCTGHPLTRHYYEEQMSRLFTVIPDLGGVFLIIGGEGLLHCYTAPSFRLRHQTDCPHCGAVDPVKSVA
jgi:hypothetical protein